MSDDAIRVEKLGKKYSIGARQKRNETLRETLVSTLKAPFEWANKSGHASESESTIWALKDVSFDVKRGDAIGIIGRNGAGKSTLLKILSRITEPTEGHVRICGRIASLLEVGTGFHPELTGRENIYLNGAIIGMKRAEIKRKFDEIVTFAEIDKFVDTPVKHYSSGMYVRLAFAVAAHIEPEILIVDEVLAVGDAQFQKKCLGKMRSSATEGRTVIFVSHNVAAISTLCSRALLLDRGGCLYNGQVQTAISRYEEMAPEETGQVIWSDPSIAPGNERIRIHAVQILSEGETTAKVDIQNSIDIQIDYWNFKPDSRISVSIHLLDKFGSPVLASANNHSTNLGFDEWFDKPHPVGLFRSTCNIPANFLNEGLYSITAIVLTDINRIDARLDGIVSFMVRDTTVREYTGIFIGVVRPKLAWRSSNLSN